MLHKTGGAGTFVHLCFGVAGSGGEREGVPVARPNAAAARSGRLQALGRRGGRRRTAARCLVRPPFSPAQSPSLVFDLWFLSTHLASSHCSILVLILSLYSFCSGACFARQKLGLLMAPEVPTENALQGPLVETRIMLWSCHVPYEFAKFAPEN